LTTAARAPAHLRDAPVERSQSQSALPFGELLALGAVIFFGLLCFYPALGARFVLVDDHEILNVLPPIGAPASEMPHLDLPGMVLVNDPAVGRFRPLYWTIRIAETALLGDHPNAWHALILVYGFASAGLLYGAARTLGASRLQSSLLGAWLLVAPGVSSLWVRLGADDTRATVFLTLALFAAARAVQSGSPEVRRRWDIVLVLAASAAALSKEAFALASIAVAFFRAWLPMSRSHTWRPSSVPLASWLILLVGAGEMVIAAGIAATAGEFSHGGRYLSLPNPISYFGGVVHNAAILAYVAMFWVVLLLVFAGAWRSWRTLLLASVPAFVVVVPQLLLYSQQGVFEGKYEAAPAIGVVALSMGSIVWLRRVRARGGLYRLGIGAWIAGLVAFGFSTWTYARSFSDDSVQLAHMVETVAAAAPSGQTIGIAGDPGNQYEPILSLVDFIHHQGRTDAPIELLPLTPDTPYSPLSLSLATDLATSKLAALPTSTCQELGALIVVGDEAKTRSALPCLNTGFKRVEFTNMVLLWGGDAVSLRLRLPGLTQVGYTLFVAD
jgi:hypothetical protein